MGKEKNPTPGRGMVSTLPAGFSRQASREGGGRASAAETLSDACVSGQKSGPRSVRGAGWELRLEVGTNSPGVLCPQPNT